MNNYFINELEFIVFKFDFLTVFNNRLQEKLKLRSFLVTLYFQNFDRNGIINRKGISSNTLNTFYPFRNCHENITLRIV